MVFAEVLQKEGLSSMQLSVQGNEEQSSCKFKIRFKIHQGSMAGERKVVCQADFENASASCYMVAVLEELNLTV